MTDICLGCGRAGVVPAGYANCGNCTSRYLTAAFAPRAPRVAQEVPGPPLTASPAPRRSPADNAADVPPEAGAGDRYKPA